MLFKEVLNKKCYSRKFWIKNAIQGRSLEITSSVLFLCTDNAVNLVFQTQIGLIEQSQCSLSFWNYLCWNQRNLGKTKTSLNHSKYLTSEIQKRIINIFIFNNFPSSGGTQNWNISWKLNNSINYSYVLKIPHIGSGNHKLFLRDPQYPLEAPTFYRNSPFSWKPRVFIGDPPPSHLHRTLHVFNFSDSKKNLRILDKNWGSPMKSWESLIKRFITQYYLLLQHFSATLFNNFTIIYTPLLLHAKLQILLFI